MSYIANSAVEALENVNVKKNLQVDRLLFYRYQQVPRLPSMFFCNGIRNNHR